MRFPRAVPVAIFLLVAAITTLSVYSIERGEEQRDAAQLRNRAVAVASALERRANSNSAYLRAGAALIATLDQIEPSRFRRFISELRLDADARGAEGIGWAMVVNPQNVDQFEEIASREKEGRVRLRPALQDRRIAVPVTFLEPDTARNRRSLGFDMFSEPVRRAAMIQAERTATPTATGKIVLLPEAGESDAGFLIFMPVFEPAPGGRRLRGFIYSPFNAQDFLDSALEVEGTGDYAVRLYDGQDGPDSLLASIEGGERSGDVFRETISIANHPWVVEVEAASADTLSGLSMLTLIFGTLVASLLMLLVRMLTKQALEDEAALRWFEEQASIRNSLTRELNHRVKNTLANVLSIIALTRRRSKNLDEFADSLDGRIRALSATHDLLTQSDWGTTPIRSIIEAELVPYAQASEHQVDLQGPSVQLAPNDALSLGLTMHELATNAAKYGALSAPGGRVKVHWTLVSPRLVRVKWEERGGPQVAPPTRRGFGTDLIEKIVANELKSPVDLKFESDGVTCSLTVPVREPSEFAMRAARQALDQPSLDGLKKPGAGVKDRAAPAPSRKRVSSGGG